MLKALLIPFSSSEYKIILLLLVKRSQFLADKILVFRIQRKIMQHVQDKNIKKSLTNKTKKVKFVF
jgi:hypothetical protein